VANEGTVKLWETRFGTELDSVVGEFYGIAFSSALNRLAVAKKNRTIELWGKPVVMTDGDGNIIKALVKDRRQTDRRQGTPEEVAQNDKTWAGRRTLKDRRKS
jgi:hypothetical protein